jgi:hypothetical protein
MKYQQSFSDVLAGLTGISLIAGLSLLAGCPSQSPHAASTPPPAAQSGSAGGRSSETSDVAPNGSESEELVPPGVVRMLKTRATLLGPHPGTAPIRLTVAMKWHHHHGPSRADLAMVTNWLKARDIRVLKILGALIHTEAPTAVWERVLGIQINDYRMDGRTFYTTTDRATLPRPIAARIIGVLGLNHAVQASCGAPCNLPPVRLPRQKAPQALTVMPPPSTASQSAPDRERK